MATKLVNGERITMTAQEEAAFEAQRAADRAAVAVPQSIPFRKAKTQMRLTAHGNGSLWDAAVSLVEGMDAGEAKIKMQGFLYDSMVYERNRSELISLATALGLSGAAVDQLFIDADKL